jgi:hypothetical protein
MKLVDLTGEKFGDWTVICQDFNLIGNWICVCVCGEEKSVQGSSLKDKKTTRCRDCYYISKRKNLIGEKFGKWLVIAKNENKNYWHCKCECGEEKILYVGTLRNCKGEGCWKCWTEKNKTDDLTGKKFNKWLVLNKDEKKSTILDYWQCECECGRIKSVYGSHLRLNKSISCRKCSEQKHKGKLNSRIWCRIVRSAKKRNLEINLGEPEEAKKFLYDLLYKTQECRCALSGLPITISTTIKGDIHRETTASLDRINSKKGYVKDNVQWVHKWINKMKMDLDEDFFIMFCEAVVQNKQGRFT